MEIDRYQRKIEQLGRQGYPTVAALELTERCNASCPYCYIDPDNRRPGLATDRWRWVIDKLADGGILNIIITGGDPFVRDDILEILGHAASKDFFGIAVYTNGTLLCEDHFAFLAAHRDTISEVKFSGFSHEPSVNDSYFGIPGATEKIIHAGRRLMRAGVRVRMSLAALDFNVDSLSQTQEFYERHGFKVSVAIFKILTAASQRKKLAGSITRDFMDKCVNRIPPELQEARAEYVREKMSSRPGRTSLCQGRLTSIMVDCRGDIAPCVAFRSLRVGSILEDRPLCETLRASDQRRRICRMTKEDIPACASCEYRPLCPVCLGRIHTLSGRLDAEDPQTCRHTKALHAMCEACHA